MNLKTQRNLLAVAVVVLLIVLGVLAGTGALSGAAGGQGKGKGTQTENINGKDTIVVISDEELAVDPAAPGQSVVGTGLLGVRGMTVEKSGGNDVVAIADNSNPVAYGGALVFPNGSWKDVGNRCSLPGGFADVGSGDYTPATKKHDYTFSFAEPIQKFKIGFLDWGDYLPFGACPNNVCAIVMTAYNANGEVVNQTQKSFTVTERFSSLSRTSAEYGNTRISGDACMALDEQPGRFSFEVNGHGITRVTIAFANKQSMDPHTALWVGPMQIVPDRCYNFIALSTSGRKSFDFSGTAGVAFCGGGVWSNSGAESSNNSVPTTYASCQQPIFTSVGDWIQQENLTTPGFTVNEQSKSAIADPIGTTTAAPVKPDTCGDLPADGNINGTVCVNSLKVGPGETLTLTGTGTSNVLYVAGDVDIQGTFSANNLFIYTVNEFAMNAQAVAPSLTANTTGPWAGFLLWAAGSKGVTLNGGSNSNWVGTIYSPAGPAKINGGSDSILRVNLIADTIDFAGNNNTVTYCDPSVNFARSNITP
jgi:hypothetical protein